jgi:hypothetical protein
MSRGSGTPRKWKQKAAEQAEEPRNYPKPFLRTERTFIFLF